MDETCKCNNHPHATSFHDRQVEDSNQELIEEIYELYTELISKGQDDRNYCYKSYYLVRDDNDIMSHTYVRIHYTYRVKVMFL